MYLKQKQKHQYFYINLWAKKNKQYVDTCHFDQRKALTVKMEWIVLYEIYLSNIK